MTRDQHDKITATTRAEAIVTGTGYRALDVLGPCDRLRRELTAMQRRLWCELSAAGWSSVRIGRVVGRHYSTILVGMKKERVA